MSDNFQAINTRIVLVQTSHPGNIGSAARAMKTMGLHDLVLVAPKRFPAKEAEYLASGATDLLEKARVVETVDEAIADCDLVLGTSTRDRSLAWPLVNPSRAAELVLEHSGKTAILFGREDKGLSNEELHKCHYHVQIEANPDYSSLNLAAAVQVLSYQLRSSLSNQQQTEADKADAELAENGYDGELANRKAMALLFEHLDDTLHDIGFLDRKTPNKVMPRLKRVLNRARIDMTELSIIRGVLSAMNDHLDSRD